MLYLCTTSQGLLGALQGSDMSWPGHKTAMTAIELVVHAG